MADTNKDGIEDVTVDTTALRTAATNFLDLSDNLTPYTTPLKNATIAAGSFPDAALIVKAIQDAVGLGTTTGGTGGNLLTNVDNLGKALKEISENLVKVASEYEKTEDDNEGEAKRLDDMIKDINSTLHGDGTGTVTKLPDTTIS